ncbi:LLM class flavin-dependent oxidoreductase [Actinomadura sp. 9N407]|uniref:LLM class flavin-dependent oxidoreductase n=1 Tax=Actinomadura sp. 9N407 TaxID=3375154 RepID=UPI0037A94813
MDHGHDIEFGTFILPTSLAPHQPVELAQLSEQLGYELASFQDHPYTPTLLDAWTLMSYVAARTERIRLTPNVLNLPMRPPAVLARAAISLDLLSHGRVELALGAGYFWDAIESMGMARLTPGQGVDALGEAIEIIRGIWDTDARGGVRVDGLYHQAVGARRGPPAAHSIPILIGSSKPRMLELTGRVADGWLPALHSLDSPNISEATRLVDEAAVAAGRSPGDVRRYLNIQPALGLRSQNWAEQLASFAIDEGFSLFILVTDDPNLMRRFAAEVAPSVRELVANSRTLST